jgi:hypothetical protein
MYPTFLQSDQRVVKGILAEAGLTFPEPEGRRPWNPSCGVSRPQLVRDWDNSVLRKQELKFGHFPGKDRSQMQGVSRKGKAVSVKPARTQGIKRKLTTARGTDDRKTVHRSPILRPRTRDESEEANPDNKDKKRKKPRATCAVIHGESVGVSTVDRDDLHAGNTPVHQQPVRLEKSRRKPDGPGVPLAEAYDGEDTHSIREDMTREEVMERARRYAESLTLDGEYRLGEPPTPQPVAGLYYLLDEYPKGFTEVHALLHDPQSCMRALEDLEYKGDLEGKILVAIGPWVKWREAQVRNCFVLRSLRVVMVARHC